MKIEIKGFQSFRAREGLGYNAKVYFDGKLIVDVHEAGDGGEPSYYFKTNEAEGQFDAWVASFPPDTPEQVEAEWREFLKDEDEIKRMVAKFPNGRPIDRETAMSRLVYKFETDRSLKLALSLGSSSAVSTPMRVVSVLS